MTDASPTIGQRELGKRLRELRDQKVTARLSLIEKVIGTSQTRTRDLLTRRSSETRDGSF